MDKGYKNINIGVDHEMIWSKPKLAAKNDAKQLSANQTW